MLVSHPGAPLRPSTRRRTPIGSPAKRLYNPNVAKTSEPRVRAAPAYCEVTPVTVANIHEIGSRLQWLDIPSHGQAIDMAEDQDRPARLDGRDVVGNGNRVTARNRDVGRQIPTHQHVLRHRDVADRRPDLAVGGEEVRRQAWTQASAAERAGPGRPPNGGGRPPGTRSQTPRWSPQRAGHDQNRAGAGWQQGSILRREYVDRDRSTTTGPLVNQVRGLDRVRLAVQRS
jgi:hypothetical protein